MSKRTLGSLLFVVSFVWVISETAYFGWNVFPRSGPEMVADGLGIILLLIALFAQSGKP